MPFLVELEFHILYAIQKLGTSWLDEIMTAITFLADKGWFWIALAVIFLLGKNTRTLGIAMLISFAIGFLVGNAGLKPLIARQRPCWLDPSVSLLIANPRDFSFPSGHSLISFEGAACIWFHNKKWGMPALILAALIAFSRLYLFVHFPTDVLAGGLLGIGISWFICRILEPKGLLDMGQ